MFPRRPGARGWAAAPQPGAPPPVPSGWPGPETARNLAVFCCSHRCWPVLLLFGIWHTHVSHASLLLEFFLVWTRPFLSEPVPPFASLFLTSFLPNWFSQPGSSPLSKAMGPVRPNCGNNIRTRARQANGVNIWRTLFLGMGPRTNSTLTGQDCSSTTIWLNLMSI